MKTQKKKLTTEQFVIILIVSVLIAGIGNYFLGYSDGWHRKASLTEQIIQYASNNGGCACDSVSWPYWCEKYFNGDTSKC